MSMHGSQHDALNNKYFPAEYFTGYNGTKFSFVKDAVSNSKFFNIVVISHINLLLVAWLIKKKSPSTKVILLAHGIEIWDKLPAHKLKMLQCCDKIVSVSNFTKNKIIDVHNIPSEKCLVLNNCIDPFLMQTNKKEKDNVFLKKIGLDENDIVLLTLTRLSLKDRYKGYDYVIKALKNIVVTNPNVKYLLAGGYTVSEKLFLDKLIAEAQMQNNVILSGYVEENDLPALFSTADIFVMPSIKEGFGIVFVEAMYYGIPVIASNADGSVDALLNGKLGILTEAENEVSLTNAINEMIDNYDKYIPNQQLLLDHFSYDTYKRNFEKVIN